MALTVGIPGLNIVGYCQGETMSVGRLLAGGGGCSEPPPCDPSTSFAYVGGDHQYVVPEHLPGTMLATLVGSGTNPVGDQIVVRLPYAPGAILLVDPGNAGEATELRFRGQLIAKAQGSNGGGNFVSDALQLVSVTAAPSHDGSALIECECEYAGCDATGDPSPYGKDQYVRFDGDTWGPAGEPGELTSFQFVVPNHIPGTLEIQLTGAAGGRTKSNLSGSEERGGYGGGLVVNADYEPGTELTFHLGGSGGRATHLSANGGDLYPIAGRGGGAYSRPGGDGGGDTSVLFGDYDFDSGRGGCGGGGASEMWANGSVALIAGGGGGAAVNAPEVNNLSGGSGGGFLNLIDTGADGQGWYPASGAGQGGFGASGAAVGAGGEGAIDIPNAVDGSDGGVFGPGGVGGWGQLGTGWTSGPSATPWTGIGNDTDLGNDGNIEFLSDLAFMYLDGITFVALVLNKDGSPVGSTVPPSGAWTLAHRETISDKSNWGWDYTTFEMWHSGFANGVFPCTFTSPDAERHYGSASVARQQGKGGWGQIDPGTPYILDMDVVLFPAGADPKFAPWSVTAVGDYGFPFLCDFTQPYYYGRWIRPVSQNDFRGPSATYSGTAQSNYFGAGMALAFALRSPTLGTGYSGGGGGGGYRGGGGGGSGYTNWGGAGGGANTALVDTDNCTFVRGAGASTNSFAIVQWDCPTLACGAGSEAFTTPGEHTFIVPEHVEGTMTMSVAGAGGGTSRSGGPSSVGGRGGGAVVTLDYPAGTVLNCFVGAVGESADGSTNNTAWPALPTSGAGGVGWQGRDGGAGAVRGGAGGGGASAVRTSGGTTLVIAGGGGGGGGKYSTLQGTRRWAGDGGGSGFAYGSADPGFAPEAGVDGIGDDPDGGDGGTAGTLVSAGSGGAGWTYPSFTNPGQAGTDASSGVGGDGGRGRARSFWGSANSSSSSVGFEQDSLVVGTAISMAAAVVTNATCLAQLNLVKNGSPATGSLPGWTLLYRVSQAADGWGYDFVTHEGWINPSVGSVTGTHDGDAWSGAYLRAGEPYPSAAVLDEDIITWPFNTTGSTLIEPYSVTANEFFRPLLLLHQTGNNAINWWLGLDPRQPGTVESGDLGWGNGTPAGASVMVAFRDPENEGLMYLGGGGGGGGYFGAGGGGGSGAFQSVVGAGGGGGSSYVNSALTVTDHYSSAETSDGQIVFNWTCP